MKTTQTQTTESAAKMAGLIVPDGCRRIAELFYAGVDRRIIQRRHGVTQTMIDAVLRRYYEESRRPEPPSRGVLAFPVRRMAA